MRIRIAWVRCPDCGRHGTDGGCFVVQRRGWLFWHDLITTFDRAGGTSAAHFPTVEKARGAVQEYFKPKPQDFRVVEEFDR